VGIKHYKYWTHNEKTQKITAKKGSGTLKNFVSVAVDNGLILTGSECNTLTKWTGSSVKESIMLRDLKA
jgi:hypothetical protein